MRVPTRSNSVVNNKLCANDALFQLSWLIFLLVILATIPLLIILLFVDVFSSPLSCLISVVFLFISILLLTSFVSSILFSTCVSLVFATIMLAVEADVKFLLSLTVTSSLGSLTTSFRAHTYTAHGDFIFFCILWRWSLVNIICTHGFLAVI